MTTKSKPSLTIKSSLCLKTPAGSQGLDAKWTFCGQTWFWFCCQSEGFCYCFAKPVGVIFLFMSSQILCFWQTMATNCCFGWKGQNKNRQHFLPGGHPLRRKLCRFEVEKNMNFIPAHPCHPSMFFHKCANNFYYYCSNVKLFLKNKSSILLINA